MMTTASEHKIDKVEKMAGGKGHVIIEHLLGEARKSWTASAACTRR